MRRGKQQWSRRLSLAIACSLPVLLGAPWALTGTAGAQTGSISGIKCEDPDAGSFCDEPIGSWTLYLDIDNDDQMDPVEPTASTDGGGAYSFSDLTPGTYTVREELPPGYGCSHPGTTPATCEYSVTVEANESEVNKDFINFRFAAVSGSKFEDLNADGDRDTGEPGLQGFTVFADSNGSGTLDAGEMSAQTGADGNYTIAGVRPGIYTIREVQQSGFTCSMPAPCEYAQSLTSAQHATGKDFGNHRPASISEQPPTGGGGNGGGSGSGGGDRDGDGVADASDLCPDQTAATSTGCPIADGAGGGATGGATDLVPPSLALAGGSITASRNGTFGYRVACTASEVVCTGRVDFQSASAFRAQRRRRVKLGSASFNVPGGRSQVLRVRLSRRGRALLKRRPSLRVRARASVQGQAGNRGSFTRTFTLRAAPRRR